MDRIKGSSRHGKSGGSGLCLGQVNWVAGQVELILFFTWIIYIYDGITNDLFGQKVKFKFASKTKIDIDNLSYEKDSPMNALIQGLMMSSCQNFIDDFKGNIHSANTINRPNINNTLQKSDNDAWIRTTTKWDNINIYTTSKWIIMAPKGKAPVQDYSQNKRFS